MDVLERKTEIKSEEQKKEEELKQEEQEEENTKRKEVADCLAKEQYEDAVFLRGDDEIYQGWDVFDDIYEGVKYIPLEYAEKVADVLLIGMKEREDWGCRYYAGALASKKRYYCCKAAVELYKAVGLMEKAREAKKAENYWRKTQAGYEKKATKAVADEMNYRSNQNEMKRRRGIYF